VKILQQAWKYKEQNNSFIPIAHIVLLLVSLLIKAQGLKNKMKKLLPLPPVPRLTCVNNLFSPREERFEAGGGVAHIHLSNTNISSCPSTIILSL